MVSEISKGPFTNEQTNFKADTFQYRRVSIQTRFNTDTFQYRRGAHIMKAVRLRTEYLKNPLGIDIADPKFSWNCEGGKKQTAYRIVVRDRWTDDVLWDSGKVNSPSMNHTPYQGRPLQSRTAAVWSVQLWDESGSDDVRKAADAENSNVRNNNEESSDDRGELEQASFELGLLSADEWKAKWITGDYRPKKGQRYPADYFRKSFKISGPLKCARLYASAKGLYTVCVNGVRLSDHILAPGMTDYRKRIQYQTYDLTDLLQSGSGCAEEYILRSSDGRLIGSENTLELTLADGWYRGSSAAYGVTNVYGTETAVIAQLELTYENGTREVIATDESFDWSADGPVRFADLKDGEIYDAARKPSYEGKAKCSRDQNCEILCASNNVPVRERERFTPEISRTEDGTVILNFGQNIAGYLEVNICQHENECRMKETGVGKPGEEICITCGEILGKDGKVDLSGVQETIPAKGLNQITTIQKLMGKTFTGDTKPTPMQQIRIRCGSGELHYRTQFAVFGFQYAQIDLPKNSNLVIRPEDITAVAVYSDLEQTGTFTCSNELINRLHENTVWSMKGNFLDLPTDCPTRERLGWTGDAQIFFQTGAYMMDTAAFFRKWLRDMEDSRYNNGLIPAVLPYQGVEMMYRSTGSSVGWADAIYLIPYRYYQVYHDTALLEQYWPMMERYIVYLKKNLGPKDRKLKKENPEFAYLYEKGVHLGEWLEPEQFRDKVYGASARHPEECTAYLYLTMKTMAKIAGLLGKTAEKQEYLADAAHAKAAYRAWIRRADSESLTTHTGERAEMHTQTYSGQHIDDHTDRYVPALDTDRQAKLVRPLALGILEDDDREFAERRLVQAAENFNYCVGTGFLSTPFLLSVLTEAGETETAYRMLENTNSPGWLYEVVNGATTVWESWEGKYSRNHYSPGAVCQWLYDTILGIRLADNEERKFVLNPVPGGTLTHAEGSWQSPYGMIRSRWEKKDGRIEFRFEIPANTTAELQLPDGTTEYLEAGEYVREI